MPRWSGCGRPLRAAFVGCLLAHSEMGRVREPRPCAHTFVSPEPRLAASWLTFAVVAKRLGISAIAARMAHRSLLGHGPRGETEDLVQEELLQALGQLESLAKRRHSADAGKGAGE